MYTFMAVTVENGLEIVCMMNGEVYGADGEKRSLA